MKRDREHKLYNRLYYELLRECKSKEEVIYRLGIFPESEKLNYYFPQKLLDFANEVYLKYLREYYDLQSLNPNTKFKKSQFSNLSKAENLLEIINSFIHPKKEELNKLANSASDFEDIWATSVSPVEVEKLRKELINEGFIGEIEQFHFSSRFLGSALDFYPKINWLKLNSKSGGDNPMANKGALVDLYLVLREHKIVKSQLSNASIYRHINHNFSVLEKAPKIGSPNKQRFGSEHYTFLFELIERTFNFTLRRM